MEICVSIANYNVCGVNPRRRNTNSHEGEILNKPFYTFINSNIHTTGNKFALYK